MYARYFFLAVGVCLRGVNVAFEEGEGKRAARSAGRRLRIPGA